MPNTSVSAAKNKNADNNGQRDSKNNWFVPYVIIMGITVVGLVVIWTLCFWYIPLEKDRVPNFLTAAVSYLILMAMFVQAYIYKRQSETMASQEKRLIEQRDAMLQQREIMEKQANSASAQSSMMREALQESRITREIENAALLALREHGLLRGFLALWAARRLT